MLSFSTIMQTLADTGQVSIDDSWKQGRALFGGLAAALATSAAAREVAPGTPLRSLMASFVAPLGDGPLALESRLYRSGKSVSQSEGMLVQDGQILTAVQSAWGAPRAVSQSEAALPPKAMPPLNSVEDMPFLDGVMPTFLSHFNLRWIEGIPQIQSSSRRAALWVRLRDEKAHLYPEAWMCAIADMPPPVMLTRYAGRSPVSSLSWSLEFVQTPDQVNSDWFFLDYHLDSAADGYSQQSGLIYDERGQLVAYSRQCMVYFEPKPKT